MLKRDEDIYFAATKGHLFQLNYWYSVNNYKDPYQVCDELEQQGYVLSKEYYDEILTSFRIIGKRQG